MATKINLKKKEAHRVLKERGFVRIRNSKYSPYDFKKFLDDGRAIHIRLQPSGGNHNAFYVHIDNH